MTTPDGRLGMHRTLKSTTVDAAQERVVAALKGEGFGVLTEVNIAQTLKTKINVEFRPYRILGACNPALAHKALSQSLETGLMLPCNVVLYAEGADVEVMAVDPTQMPVASGQAAVLDVAREVREKLLRVLEAV